MPAWLRGVTASFTQMAYSGGASAHPVPSYRNEAGLSPPELIGSCWRFLPVIGRSNWATATASWAQRASCLDRHYRLLKSILQRRTTRSGVTRDVAWRWRWVLLLGVGPIAWPSACAPATSLPATRLPICIPWCGGFPLKAPWLKAKQPSEAKESRPRRQVCERFHSRGAEGR